MYREIRFFTHIHIWLVFSLFSIYGGGLAVPRRSCPLFLEVKLLQLAAVEIKNIFRELSKLITVFFRYENARLENVVLRHLYAHRQGSGVPTGWLVNRQFFNTKGTLIASS